MTEAPPAPILVGMPRPARVTLEIDRASDPITGQISDARGTRAFVGWLELAIALQAGLEFQDEDDRATARPPDASASEP